MFLMRLAFIDWRVETKVSLFVDSEVFGVVKCKGLLINILSASVKF